MSLKLIKIYLMGFGLQPIVIMYKSVHTKNTHTHTHTYTHIYPHVYYMNIYVYKLTVFTDIIVMFPICNVLITTILFFL